MKKKQIVSDPTNDVILKALGIGTIVILLPGAAGAAVALGAGVGLAKLVLQMGRGQ